MNTTEVMWLTPEDAVHMLQANTRNRPIRTAIVARYAGDMASGNWVFAADPIRFDTDGRLIDGQHRLHALASLEHARIPFLVVTGLSPDAQLVMDQGRKRSAGQQLALLGIRDPNIVAAGVALHLMRIAGYLFRDTHAASAYITTARIEKWVADHPNTVGELSANRVRYQFALPSVSYASAIAFHDIDPDACFEFFRLLKAGAGEGHPVNTLDKRLQRDRVMQVKITKRDQLGMFFQTWNMWREGRRATKIQRPRGGYTAENFPEVAA